MEGLISWVRRAVGVVLDWFFHSSPLRSPISQVARITLWSSLFMVAFAAWALPTEYASDWSGWTKTCIGLLVLCWLGSVLYSFDRNRGIRQYPNRSDRRNFLGGLPARTRVSYFRAALYWWCDHFVIGSRRRTLVVLGANLALIIIWAIPGAAMWLWSWICWFFVELVPFLFSTLSEFFSWIGEYAVYDFVLGWALLIAGIVILTVFVRRAATRVCGWCVERVRREVRRFWHHVHVRHIEDLQSRIQAMETERRQFQTSVEQERARHATELQRVRTQMEDAAVRHLVSHAEAAQEVAMASRLIETTRRTRGDARFARAREHCETAVRLLVVNEVEREALFGRVVRALEEGTATTDQQQ